MKERLLITEFVLLIAMAAGGCGNAGGTDLLQSERISACDGFAANGGSFFAPVPPPPENYCDAEVLFWRYDAQSEQLSLLDQRVFLNCCGKHSIRVERRNGTYVFTERDEPGRGGARCGCMCTYDFGAEAQPVPEELIHLQIVRVVTDSDRHSGKIWEGDLDLAQGSGFEVINDIPLDSFCSNS